MRDNEPTRADEDLKALEAFLVANADLERLEALLGRFNIFEAIGVVRRELRHSDFLAFLMDPKGTHGLGEAFAKRLLQRILMGSEDVPVPVTPMELELWDLGRVEVRREWQRIDILLLDWEHKLAVIVENKIGSGERSDQLLRYYRLVEQHHPGWRIIAVYLTPGGDPPSHESYLPVDYGLVSEVIDDLAEGRALVVNDDVKTVMTHYTDMLRRNIVSNSDVTRMCRQIYQKHKKALDLIYDHGPARWKKVHKLFKRLVAETQGLKLKWEWEEYPEDYVVFDIEDWDLPSLRVRDGEGNNSLTVHWVLSQFFEGVVLYLELVSGDDPTRRKLFNLAHEERSLFKDVSEQLTQEETMLYLCRLLPPELYETGTDEECERKIRRRWVEFFREDLPRIETAVKKEVGIWESDGMQEER